MNRAALTGTPGTLGMEGVFPGTLGMEGVFLEVGGVKW